MSDDTDGGSVTDDVIGYARDAERAVERLCRATSPRPRLTPSEVDEVLGTLSATVAALPQAASQLADILRGASGDRLLVMDTMAEVEDPGLAIFTARSHLDAVREPALTMSRAFDSARNQTAHITVVDEDDTSRHRSRRIDRDMPRSEVGAPTHGWPR